MNKNLFLCATMALLCLSCSKKDEPINVQQHQVTFRVPQLAVETEHMSAPGVRKVAPLTDEDGGQ